MSKTDYPTLTIRNWDRWQTYRKDRGQPPWIKVHQTIRYNPEWIALTDAQRGQLLMIWMLAADKNGVIPNDASVIQRVCFMETKPDLDFYIAQGFVLPAQRRRRAKKLEKKHDALEEEAEEEVEEEAETEGADALDLSPGLPFEKWVEWEQHRIEIKKRLTASTVTKQINFLAKQPDPSAVIDASITNGWTGLFEVKLNGTHQQNGSSRISAVERVRRANAHLLEETGGAVVDENGRVIRAPLD